jgi:hypothetical protein
VRSIFSSVDANRILQISLTVGTFDDFVAWNYTETGMFTVKSAYHVEWKHQFGPRTSSERNGSPSTINLVWRIMWRLQILSEVKIFLWNSLRGSVPLKSVLVNRHIGDSGKCPVCSLAA